MRPEIEVVGRARRRARRCVRANVFERSSARAWGWMMLCDDTGDAREDVARRRARAWLLSLETAEALAKAKAEHVVRLERFSRGRGESDPRAAVV